jgi:hypothetical protein
MQTNWQGLAVPNFASNVLFTAVYDGLSRWIVLSDIPNVVTTVHLPALTAGVQFWTAEAEVWVALDGAPGPLVPPLQAPTIPADAFLPGLVILPGQWQVLAVSEDTLHDPHTVQLVSQDPSPRVLMTALVQLS